MTRLDIMSDPICPWCYIGKANLDRAIAESGEIPFEIDWRVFQLDPGMAPEGVDRRTHIEAKFGGPDQVREIHARIEKAASEAGLTINFDRIERTPNTMDAHRLIRWSRAIGQQSAMVDRLFADYFVEGRDISNHEVLIEAARSIGMETEVVARLLSSDADREQLRAEEAEARKMGVNAVPCFILGGRYVIQGAQPVETWSKLIDELIAARDQQGSAPS
ncbi:MAG TPA: DsbA family oxidoreductase [Paracoccaceae bacterium]|nr:DsbA family oxidoreductase [Paracoccaceae bacterium]